jgi:hypothetical protein
MKPLFLFAAGVFTGAFILFAAGHGSSATGTSRYTIQYAGNLLVRLDTTTGESWYYQGGWLEMKPRLGSALTTPDTGLGKTGDSSTGTVGP